MHKSFLFVWIAFAFFSCSKKNNDSPDPSTSDTSTLLKSAVSYSYDEDGHKPADSTVTRYLYDDQRRPVLIVRSFGKIYLDSLHTVYTSNQKIEDHLISNKELFWNQSHSVSYLNASGRPDSVVTDQNYFDIVNGNQTNSLVSKALSVFFRDANGNDTLEVQYDIGNGARKVFAFHQRSYVNNQLRLEQYFQVNGVQISSHLWENQNLIKDTSFNEGKPYIYHISEYSDALSAGLELFSGSRNLTTALHQTTFAEGIPYPGLQVTYSYTFDDAKRVNTMKATANAFGNTQFFFTYY